jgi:hypothetical protein
LQIPYTLKENSQENWIGYSVGKKQLIGAGDPQRLNDIIKLFKEIWESSIEEKQ